MATSEGVRRRADEFLAGLYSEIPELKRMVADVAESMAIEMPPVIPLHNETVAVSLHAPKTTALLYDRVWTPSVHDVPTTVHVNAATDEELALRIVTYVAEALYHRGRNEPAPTLRTWERLGRLGYAREVAQELAAVGISAEPAYESTAEYESEYHAGDTPVVVAVLSNVALPVESELAWEQVVELRLDAAARAKLRRLKHWLDAEMVGRRRSFIEDEISIRIEEYEAVLKKHGIKTALGSLSSILDAKFLTSGAAAVASLAYAT